MYQIGKVREQLKPFSRFLPLVTVLFVPLTEELGDQTGMQVIGVGRLLLFNKKLLTLDIVMKTLS